MEYRAGNTLAHIAYSIRPSPSLLCTHTTPRSQINRLIYSWSGEGGRLLVKSLGYFGGTNFRELKVDDVLILLLELLDFEIVAHPHILGRYEVRSRKVRKPGDL